jgi:hypothetical protein
MLAANSVLEDKASNCAESATTARGLLDGADPLRYFRPGF